jgi:hypothetical protein
MSTTNKFRPTLCYGKYNSNQTRRTELTHSTEQTISFKFLKDAQFMKPFPAIYTTHRSTAVHKLQIHVTINLINNMLNILVLTLNKIRKKI